MGGARTGEPPQDPRLPAARPTSTGYEILAPKQLADAPRAIDAAHARVWGVLAQAYEEVGLPVTGSDADALTLEARNLVLRGTLVGQPVSAFADCGVTAAGTVANVYRVTLTVTTRLQARAGGTALATDLNARASSPATSSAPVRCASTGRAGERDRRARHPAPQRRVRPTLPEGQKPLSSMALMFSPASALPADG